MRIPIRACQILIGVLLPALGFAQSPAIEHFEQKIRPILSENCTMCHSSAAPIPPGGLRLDSPEGIRRGGNSGPVLDVQSPDQSLLLRALRYTDKNLKMPPGGPLPAEQVAEIEAWVRSGAPMPNSPGATAQAKAAPTLWSLQKPKLTPPPEVAHRDWARNDIDRFILQKLEAKGLAPSPEADRRMLIRRAYYDLIGLPPSTEETEAFVLDKSPTAYEALIDRLLASPHYGERWGRHWLDVARYADSASDPGNAGQRYAWSYTYRDWVINSFNSDLPYDRFLLYQLAADRIPKIEPRHLAALGFLSLGREVVNNFHEGVDDRIDAVSRGMLGLTVACARCHDHKYDPILTRDYYSFYGMFANIREPRELPLLAAHWTPSAKDTLYLGRLNRIEEEDHAYRARRHAERIAFFKSQTADYLLAARDAERLTNPETEELVRERQLNLTILKRWRAFLEKSKSSRDPVFLLWHHASELADFSAGWPATLSSENGGSPVVAGELKSHPAASLKDLAGQYASLLQRYDRPQPYAQPDEEQLRSMMRGPQSPLGVSLDDFELIYSEGDSNNTKAIRGRYVAMRALYAYDGGSPRAMAVEDEPRPKPAHVFIRGNPNNPGAATPPRFLSCIAGPDSALFRDGNGRLDLARAIIDPSNPLTARVMVNRVWLHHFGAGLVRTPSDFGNRGDPPTHPELLDYLAVRFVESGWSLKKLHRMIMHSAGYRQASTDSEAGRKADPENLLLWRMNRQRLDIESLRDSMLSAAGKLDLRPGGVPFALTARPSVPRRTVYGFVERGRIPGILSAFDFASPEQSAPMRQTTTVPQQALFFLNSPFVLEQAAAVAARSDAPKTANITDRIQRMYQIVFGRAALASEVAAGTHFVESAPGNDAPPPAPQASPWRYGTGLFDPDTGRVVAFKEFRCFNMDVWQGGSVLPAAGSGKAALRATGGEPGDLPSQAVVRRWVSPVSGTVSIEGTLSHGQGAVPAGDGIRGRIVSSRSGKLASWSLNGSSAETKLSGIKVEKGDTLDFIVDSRSDLENDGFGWAPIIKSGDSAWDSKIDFRGPAPQPLDVWARYAQVLLESNEFAFVD